MSSNSTNPQGGPEVTPAPVLVMAPAPGTTTTAATTPKASLAEATSALLGPPRSDVQTSGFVFYILGPRRGLPNRALWATYAELLSWTTITSNTEPQWISRAMRSIYVGETPASQLIPPALTPGTVVARVRIHTARILINGVQYDYQVASGPPVDVTLALQSENADWIRLATPNGIAPASRLVQAVCVAGEIPFGRFVRHPQAPVSQGKWEDRLTTFLTDIQSPVLSSSGLGFDAQTKLPWGPGSNNETIISASPYLLEVRLPNNTAELTSPLVALPDRERLAARRYDAARSQFQSAFRTLADALNQLKPVSPLVPGTRPRWSTFELNDRRAVPGFYWDMRMQDPPLPVVAVNTLRFEPGVWSLVFADQPLGVPNVTPRGTLTASPLVKILPIDPAHPAILLVNVRNAENPSPAVAGSPTLEYSIKPVNVDGTDVLSESIQCTSILTTYNPALVAKRLRAIGKLPEPGIAPLDPSVGNSLLLSGTTPPAPLVDDRIHPPVLFGVMPLKDGWAQLPFLNVTEQILVDSLPMKPEPDSGRVILSGGASFGTDRAELPPSPGEPVWNLTLLDAEAYDGTWTLESLKLTSISLKMKTPELIVEGLIWLANETPTAADLLPSFDNWVACVEPIVLRTPAANDPVPSPFLIRLDGLNFSETHASGGNDDTPVYSVPHLNAWTFTYVANDRQLTIDVPKPGGGTTPVTRSIYSHLVENSKFNPFEVWQEKPLVWRRHGRAPMIQSLPLTQTLTPPNIPSASRQLFPFELPLVERVPLPSLPDVPLPALPGVWQFTATGAGDWPTIASGHKPAVGDGLKLVSLSIPGLEYDRDATVGLVQAADDTDRFMPVQFRHDLPFLDEVNALAVLPKDDKPLPPEIAPAAPQEGEGLTRSEYREHWTHLADLAFFAAADASPSLVSDGRVFVAGLIEPLRWPVNALFSTSVYPGMITFQDDNGRSLVLSGEFQDALRGFEGTFQSNAANQTLALASATSAEFQVTGGSMLAKLDPGQSIRDQRGIERGATRPALDQNFLRTHIKIIQVHNVTGSTTPLADSEFDLCTALTPILLTTTTSDQWNFWFRDLPVDVTNSQFQRDRCENPPRRDSSEPRHPQRRGINNPAAMSRQLIALNGYEWRLGAANGAALQIGPLQFYPLSFEVAVFNPSAQNASNPNPESLKSFQMVGRLHLPIEMGAEDPEETEPIQRSNAVRLTFLAGKLTSIALELPDADEEPLPAGPLINEWPLSGASGAPVLRWNSITLNKDAGQNNISISVDFQLHYYSHGVSWTLPPKTLTIPFTGRPNPVNYAASDFITPPVPPASPAPPSGVAIDSAVLQLDFNRVATASRGHAYSVMWKFTWGEADQLQLVANYTEMVVSSVAPAPPPAPPAPVLTANLKHGTRLISLDLSEIARTEPLLPTLDEGVVQVQWSAVQRLTQFQVLPGFSLRAPTQDDENQRAAKGYGILSFRMTDQPGRPPLLKVLGGSLEALFACYWGVPLRAKFNQQTAREQVMGSSAGHVDVSYVSTFSTTSKWIFELSLNGFLDINNIISWPMLAQPLTPTAAATDNLITIPAVRPAGTLPKPDHLRHSIRIFLNQHIVPIAALEPSQADTTLLRFKSSGSWTTLATVEHQLAWVEFNTDFFPRTQGDLRMTTLQEVRFAAPAAMAATIRGVANSQTLNMSFSSSFNNEATATTRPVEESIRGEFSRAMKEGLAGTNGVLTQAAQNAPDTIVVHASTPAFLRTETTTRVQPANLSYLPSGTTQAILSSLDDFSNSTDEPGWLLLNFPFLGRLQPQDDSFDLQTLPAGTTWQFRTDPILHILINQLHPTVALSPLALAFANRENTTPRRIPLSEFDLARNRLFRRLDPSSLVESWFRLTVTPQVLASRDPAESLSSLNGVRSVMASVPTDDPGTLGRPEALARVYNPLRRSLPPSLDDQTEGDPSLAATNSPLIWNPQSRHFIETAGILDNSPTHSNVGLQIYSFLGPGVMIEQAGVIPRTRITQRRAAATLVPPRLKVGTQDNPQPVSLAACPYLGLEFASSRLADTGDDSGYTWVLALSELVVLDARQRATQVIATRFWYPLPDTPDLPAVYPLIRAWALSTWESLAIDSPAAIVRLREMYRAPEGDPAGVAIVYRFLSPERGKQSSSPARRAAALRTGPTQLRFTQGQYGGEMMPPAALLPFEIAPPQLSGVQPLRITEREDAGWPWGYSGMRFSVRQTENGAGVAGPPVKISAHTVATEGRLWWQSLAENVQYHVSLEAGARKVLPKLFRAAAIPAFLPSWPGIPLPDGGDLGNAIATRAPGAAETLVWQPVLPGGYTQIVTGTRPGVPYAFRSQIQTQDVATGQSVISGGLPVLHRAPRPILLPANREGHNDTALQTWHSLFQPTETRRSSNSPVDNAILALKPNPVGLELELFGSSPKSIKNGGIPVSSDVEQTWDGTLRFQFVQATNTQWNLQAELVDGDQGFAFGGVIRTSATATGAIDFPPSNLAAVTKWLKQQPHGKAVSVRVHANYHDTDLNRVKTFRQTLTFPLRIVVDQGVFRLPFEPKYILFEDPEYNRRLVTTTAQRTQFVVFSATESDTVTLSLDRREYNPTGPIYFLFFSPTRVAVSGTVALRRVRPDPSNPAGATTDVITPVVQLDNGQLPRNEAEMDLTSLTSSLVNGGHPPLQAGDSLVFTLSVTSSVGRVTKDDQVSVTVTIVEKPVNPVPEAGYALLRQGKDASVECVRFAFGPKASRIELLDPEDLKQQVVRRRAIFRWFDSRRVGGEYVDVLQKITTLGSTHFPEFSE